MHFDAREDLPWGKINKLRVDKESKPELKFDFDALDQRYVTIGEISAGNTVLSGSGAPSAGLGSDGDFYVNTSNYDFYGPKLGTWGSPVSLVGPAGASGEEEGIVGLLIQWLI